MSSKKKGTFREKVLNSDKLLPFIQDISESKIDEINEVTLGTFNDDINNISNSLIVRSIWEKGLNRKLSSIFINLLKNENSYVSLHREGYMTLHLDKKDNIEITILDFFMNDYNFERTDKDNNIREYTFSYMIKDYSAEDNQILIKGRFDLDVSIMLLDNEEIKDEELFDEEIDDEQDYFELTYDISNKIFFNKYITEDYNNDDFEEILDKEVMLLKAIFNDIDNDKIESILFAEV